MLQPFRSLWFRQIRVVVFKVPNLEMEYSGSGNKLEMLWPFTSLWLRLIRLVIFKISNLEMMVSGYGNRLVFCNFSVAWEFLFHKVCDCVGSALYFLKFQDWESSLDDCGYLFSQTLNISLGNGKSQATEGLQHHKPVSRSGKYHFQCCEIGISVAGNFDIFSCVRCSSIRTP